MCAPCFEFFSQHFQRTSRFMRAKFYYEFATTLHPHVNALTKSVHTSGFKPATVHLCPRASLRSSLLLHIHAHAHLHVEAYNCAVVPTRISKLKPTIVHLCPRASPRSSLQLYTHAHEYLRVQARIYTRTFTILPWFEASCACKAPRQIFGVQVYTSQNELVHMLIKATVINSCSHFFSVIRIVSSTLHD